ncbi:MAG: PepSY domain-containing protein [bacterium]
MKSKVTWPLILRKTHRWLGLIVGVQILFWVFGGFVMSAIPLDMVRGEHNTKKNRSTILNQAEYFNINALIARQKDDVTSVVLKTLNKQAVYQLGLKSGKNQLFNALTGQKLVPLTANKAKEIARADYINDDIVITQVTLLKEIVAEARGRRMPLWQVQFDDRFNTRLYISDDQQKVVARRNDLWRVFDFVWMLHIMDYDEREDFNHPLLIFAASLALLMVLSGLLLIQRWWVQSKRQRSLMN